MNGWRDGLKDEEVEVEVVVAVVVVYSTRSHYGLRKSRRHRK